MVREAGFEPAVFTPWVSDFKSDAFQPISPLPLFKKFFFFCKRITQKPKVCKLFFCFFCKKKLINLSLGVFIINAKRRRIRKRVEAFGKQKA